MRRWHPNYCLNVSPWQWMTTACYKIISMKPFWTILLQRPSINFAALSVFLSGINMQYIFELNLIAWPKITFKLFNRKLKITKEEGRAVSLRISCSLSIANTLLTLPNRPGKKVKWQDKNVRKYAKLKAMASLRHLKTINDDKTSENRTRF